MPVLRYALAALALGGGTVVFAAELPSSMIRDEASLTQRQLPDAQLRLGDGSVVRLSSLWREKPLLVTLFYRHCAGTCMPSLLLTREAVVSAGGLGRDYRVLGLSFDDSDTPSDMRAQAEAMGVAHDPSWLFAVGRKQDVQHIADALGYWYRRDSSTGQYDHPTLLVAVNQGRVVRALLGYPISRERFRELVLELRGSFVPYYQLPGQAFLRCFGFDPRSGAMRPDWGLLLLVAPGIIAIIVAIALFARPARPRET